MKKSFVVSGIVIALVAFLAGYLVSGGKKSPAGGRKILYYVDPMHPAYKSDKPGIAPDCGMQLEPVYADGNGRPGSGSGSDANLPPGAIRITPEQQQLIGVRTATVEQNPVAHTVRVLGRVAPDENRVYRINSSLQGFVQDVSPVTTGTFVKGDQYLAALYSPELYSLFNSYIFALNAIDRQNKLNQEAILRLRKDPNIRASRNALINVGVSETQLTEILTTRRNTELVQVRATFPGYVLQRNISLGERFERGAEFYRIADLSRVWVYADIFEKEASYFTPGVRCTLRLPHRNLTFTGRVSSVLPLYDATTRTLKVRLEVDNAGLVLRPEMFMEVELPVNVPAAITVPRDAVLDSGLKRTIFIDRGNGVFEPRGVETGRNFGERVEIVRGLKAGEKIVVSGTFLLDSESRFKNAAAGISGTPGRDPVCGMALDEERARGAGLTRQYGGRTWYFCSPEDMAKFDKAPQRYTGAAAAVEPMAAGHGAGMKAPSAPPSSALGVLSEVDSGESQFKQTRKSVRDTMWMNKTPQKEAPVLDRRGYPSIGVDYEGPMETEAAPMAESHAGHAEAPPAPVKETPNLNTIKLPPVKVVPKPDPGAAKPAPASDSTKAAPPK